VRRRGCWLIRKNPPNAFTGESCALEGPFPPTPENVMAAVAAGAFVGALVAVLVDRWVRKK